MNHEQVIAYIKENNISKVKFAFADVDGVLRGKVISVKKFLDGLTQDPLALTRKAHIEYVREAGSEGIELVMWLAMRGALNDDVEEKYRFYHVPCSNTALGHIILENK